MTVRVRYNSIFSYLQGLLIRLNLSMEFANCTKSVKDGLHPSPGVKSSDSILITFLLDSKWSAGKKKGEQRVLKLFQ